MSGNDGLKSALDEAIAQVGVMRPKEPSGEPQPDLLADLQGEFARNVGLEVIEGEGGDTGRRGPGRPKGARSKTTQEWQAFIRANYGDPMIGLAKLAFGDVGKLAKAFRVSVGEMQKRQQSALDALLPYFHQRMPQAIEIDRGVTILNLMVGLAQAATEKPVAGTVLEILENQGDSDDAGNKV